MQLHEKIEQFKIFALEYSGVNLPQISNNHKQWFSDGYQAVFAVISNRLRNEQMNTVGKEIFQLKPAQFDENQDCFAKLYVDGEIRNLKGNDRDFGLTEIMNDIIFNLGITGNFIYLPDVQAVASEKPIQDHIRQSLLQSIIDPIHITQREAKALNVAEINMIENWNLSFNVSKDMALLEVCVFHENGVARRFDSQEELFDYSRSDVWKKDLNLKPDEVPDYLNVSNDYLPITRVNPIPLYNFNNLPAEQNSLKCINPKDFLLVYKEIPYIEFSPELNQKKDEKMSFWHKFKNK